MPHTGAAEADGFWFLAMKAATPRRYRRGHPLREVADRAAATAQYAAVVLQRQPPSGDRAGFLSALTVELIPDVATVP